MCLSDNPYHWMLCPQCDLITQLPQISAGNRVSCPRCHTTLTSHWIDPRRRLIGYAMAALFMLLLANLFPLINMQVAGLTSQISLMQIPLVMITNHYSSLAMLFLLFVQCVPMICMVSVLLLVNQVAIPNRLSQWMTRLLFQLKNWQMAEIFLTGVLVSFVKLLAYGDIVIGSSFIPLCLFCLLQLRAFQCIDRRWLWQQLAPMPTLPAKPQPGVSGLSQGMRSCRGCTAILPAEQYQCPRCGTGGHARRKHSLQWTLALLITALVCYVPANMLPIMVTEMFGAKTHSTIISGVILLWSDGSYPVALVIFIASIMIPILKMMAIAWLCWHAQGYGNRDSQKMHVIYQMVEWVGRWSMVDIFVIMVLSALVRMGKVMAVYPAIGSLLFALVVILSMLAAINFDSRLNWDRHEGAKC